MQKQNVSKISSVLFGVLVLCFVIGFYAFAQWQEPGAPPPDPNAPAPLNVSDDVQQKDGALIFPTFYDMDTGYYVDPDSALYSALLRGMVGIGTITPASALEVVGTITAPKITTNTIDPVYEIAGEKYATYVSDFAGGVRTETSGNVYLGLDGRYIIDFNSLEQGSDLWLFWQTSNKDIDDVVVLLTPGFEGKSWYEKQGNKIVMSGSSRGEVSYRLTAPRVDYKEWGNTTDEQFEGINVSEY